MFELKQPTTVLLSSVTNRSEVHGDDKTPAVSFGLTYEGSARMLDTLCLRLAESWLVASAMKLRPSPQIPSRAA